MSAASFALLVLAVVGIVVFCAAVVAIGQWIDDTYFEDADDENGAVR